MIIMMTAIIKIIVIIKIKLLTFSSFKTIVTSQRLINRH
jgi:hypothetical protein